MIALQGDGHFFCKTIMFFENNPGLNISGVLDKRPYFTLHTVQPSLIHITFQLPFYIGY